MITATTLLKEQFRSTTPTTGILGVSGSPRQNGNSDILLKTILQGAEHQNVATEALNLTTLQFQGCIGCERCRRDKICTGLLDGMSMIYPQLLSNRGLVLVSPTHNYNITAWMKAFIDRLYCFYNFQKENRHCWSSQLAGQNRKAVVAAICEQENEKDMGFTLAAMREPLKALGYEIIGELPVFKLFKKGSLKAEADILQQAETLGKQLGDALLLSA